MKRLIYRTLMFFIKCYWRLTGGRHVNVFGNKISLSPETEFLNHRNLKLPQGSIKSEIVRYGDFVQAHSMVNYLLRLAHSPVVIDVGAHHGAYAVILGKILQQKGGRMIAIEPNPKSFETLKQNIKINGLEETVFCECTAIADTEGKTTISFDGVQSTISGKGSGNGVKVNVTTLDAIKKKFDLSRADILIVDVEGAELPVLKGADPDNLRDIGRIYCEMHPYAWSDFGYSGQQMKSFLDENHFRCFDMYLDERQKFDESAYIGPTLFIPSGYS